MAEETTLAAGAVPAVSEEQLRKAEAYIEAEEGVVNHLAVGAGEAGHLGRGGDVVVPPLRGDCGRLAVH